MAFGGARPDRPSVIHLHQRYRKSPWWGVCGYRSLGWTQQERELILDAMRDIESVSGLQFVDRGDDMIMKLRSGFICLMSEMRKKVLVLPIPLAVILTRVWLLIGPCMPILMVSPNIHCQGKFSWHNLRMSCVMPLV